MLQGEVKHNYGAIYENLAAQELHYFNSKKQGEIDFAYILTGDNVFVDGKRIYMPAYMLMFILKSPTPEKQIFRLSLLGI